MTRHALALPTLAVLASWPAAARAQRDDALSACKDSYVEARFDEAERCIARALPDLAELPSLLCDAYAFRAAARLAADDETGARRAMEVALAIDPAYDPEDPLLRAPRVQDLLAAARPGGRGARPVVLPEEPERRGSGVVFSARAPAVRAPLAVQLDYAFRLDSDRLGDRRRAELLEGSAARDVRRVAVRRPARAREVVYWFTLETPDGIAVTRVGSADAPLTADVTAPQRAERPDPGDRRRDSTAWYERWWLWAGVAGVVAAGVVLLVVLGQGEDTGAIRIQIQ